MSIPSHFTDLRAYKAGNRKPDFSNFLRVLKGDAPTRPTLFEFFLNEDLYERLADDEALAIKDELVVFRRNMSAYKNAGYDYITLHGSDFGYTSGSKNHQKTISLNEGVVITDWESYERYVWNEPEDFSCSRLEKLGQELPDGMKLVVFGPGGVLENVISLMGYDNLCYLLVDEPELVQRVFDDVGSRLVRYYRICGQYDAVGAMISNDDWGFNSQTMMAVADMRKYVVPWHRKIVETIHASGRPAILHSCGKMGVLWDDIIDEIGYEAKHSFEDKIEPVEDAYEWMHGRIAVLGGLDVDFLCRNTPEAIYQRAVQMLERSAGRGGYALGSGNSIPYYVPETSYLAMIAAAVWD